MTSLNNKLEGFKKAENVMEGGILGSPADDMTDKTTARPKVAYAIYGAALLGFLYYLAALVNIDNVQILALLGVSFAGFIFFLGFIEFGTRKQARHGLKLQGRIQAHCDDEASKIKAGETMRYLLDEMGAGVLMVDDRFRHILWSRAYEEIFDFPDGFLKPGLLLSEAMRWYLDEEGHDEAEVRQRLHDHTAKIEQARIDKKTIHQINMTDGRVIDVGVEFVANGCIILNFLDVTNREKANAEAMFQMGMRESLTGFPNRFLLKSHLKKTIIHAEQHKLCFPLIRLNVDNFKFINEAYGLASGDFLISNMANRLKQIVGEEAFLSHLGGDSFAIIGKYYTDKQEVYDYVQQMMKEFRQPLVILKDSHFIEVIVEMSVGITNYPEDDSSVDDLILNADIALSTAKKQNPGGVTIYDRTMHSEVRDRSKLVANIRDSIATNQFILHYQPQIDLKTGKVSGVEALMRWHHAERGWIPPSEFIPLAELTRLIIPLTEQSLPAACLQAKSWQQQGISPFPVSVNISPLHFLTDEFVSLVKDSLAGAELEPRWLDLEITEGIIMNRSTETLAKLDELADIGVKLSIDDFGTGYSSLTYLRTLPVNTLKIDRAFITDLAQEGDSRSVVEAIIRLGHSFNLKIIAEGVEDKEVLDLLTLMRCDNVQGFYFSKPLPSDQLVDWIHNYYHDSQYYPAKNTAYV